MLAEDTFLETKKGLKYASQITKKDLLLTPDLKWSKIFQASSLEGSGYNIKLDRGIILSLSQDHKILTISGEGDFIFKEVKTLNLNDVILTPFDYNVFPKKDFKIEKFSYINNYECRLPFPKTLDPELGYLLGHFIGDGSYSAKGYKIVHTVSVKEKQLTKHLLKKYKEVFNFKPKLKTYKCWEDQGVYRIEKDSKPLARFYKEYLGVVKNKSFLKIPVSILESSRGTICEFLSGLFDADGFVMKGNKYPAITSSSKYLINQIQCLFWNLGLRSYQYKALMSLKHKGKIKKFPSYNVCLRGGQGALKKFKTIIKFNAKHKRDLLEKFANRDLKKKSPNKELVYHTDLVYKCYKDLLGFGVKAREVPKTWFWAPKYTQQKTGCCPVGTIEELLNKAKQKQVSSQNLEKLKSIYNSKYIQQKIVSIEKIKNSKKFIHIETGSNYIGNGVVHEKTYR